MTRNEMAEAIQRLGTDLRQQDMELLEQGLPDGWRASSVKPLISETRMTTETKGEIRTK